MVRRLILKCFFAPGDIVVMTTILRDLKKSFPKVETEALITYPEVTFNNPNLTKVPMDSPIIEITHKDILSNRRNGDHYSNVINRIVSKEFNFPIEQTSIYPEIFLTDEEKDRKTILDKYGIKDEFYLFNAGIKNDIPLKSYPIFYWQDVIKALTRRNIQCIQVGSNKHIHPEFKNIKSLLGKTEDLRELIVLTYHAKGVITHNSLMMHLAAAFQKPCIVLGGGREPVRYAQYDNQVYLHSVGMLSCCKNTGCWKKQRNECENLIGSSMSYPACMMLIQPQTIIDFVLNYENGFNLEQRIKNDISRN